MATTPAAPFHEGELVLAHHGSMIYEARILKMGHEGGGAARYYLHYQGWNKKHDEWVPESRIMVHTPDNLIMRDKLNKEALDAAAAVASGNKKGSGGGGAATPSTGGAAGGSGKKEGAAGAPAVGRKRKADAARGEGEEEGGGEAWSGGAGSAGMRFSFPFALKRQVVEDWDMVTQKRFIIRVPKPSNFHTVATILDAYLVHLNMSTPLSLSPGGAGQGGAANGDGDGALEADNGEDKGGGRTQAPRSKRSRTEASSDAPAALGSATPGSGGGGGGGGGAPPGTFVITTPADVHAAYTASFPPDAPLPPPVQAAKDILDGIRQLFDRCAPVYLLYRFERPQFETLQRERAGDDSARPWSQVLGAEHLLRLFVKLPELIGFVTLTRDEVALLVTTVNDVLKFMAKHAASFFLNESYIKAGEGYMRGLGVTGMAAAVGIMGGGGSGRH